MWITEGHIARVQFSELQHIVSMFLRMRMMLLNATTATTMLTHAHAPLQTRLAICPPTEELRSRKVIDMPFSVAYLNDRLY